MTGAEILLMANLHTEGDTISNAEGLMYINEWLLMDLGGDAGIVDSANVALQRANDWVNLPVDFIEETEILKGNEPYWGSYYGLNYGGDYDIRNGQIRFPEEGEYTIFYIRRPAPITKLSDTPEINAVFHQCGAIYVAMRYKTYDDENSNDAQRLRAEYDMYRERAIQEHKKISRSTTRTARSVKVKPWR